MEYNKRINRHMVLQLLCLVVLVVLDQCTKALAASLLKGQNDIAVIPDILMLHYLENPGAAFGIFQNRAWLFYILTIIILILLGIVFVRIQRRLRQYPSLAGTGYRKETVNRMVFLGYILSVLAAGAVGNLIDRILRRYVIDFIDVRVIGFPVFNLADIYVTFSCIFIIIFFIFVYKEDEYFRLFK